eukprot:CAMPEP_0174878246 /NCGR_PEP_ID=MMETSP1114-20130205/82662_1 /TAXON_ID=312471 /ORGANISM="Neobodo designis, Strain CCAP 1951/1" /LENGTH=222 /DNA_ID=CAMNT_0016113633 /DNA_START=62 /DNA_END=730 /DNA_ORIENTATION=+
MPMYATVQDRFQQLRDKALSNEYTQSALSQFEGYKQQLVQLHADTQERLQARRDALLAAVQGRKDEAMDALRERRDHVVTQLDGAKAAVAKRATAAREAAESAVQAPVERATQLVNSARTAAADAIAPHEEKITKAVDVAFAYAAVAVAYVLAVWFTVLSVLRTHVPAALAYGDRAVAAARPYAEKVLAGVFAVDARVGGYVRRSVERLVEEVKQITAKKEE